MRRIINEISVLEGHDVNKLAKYMRCLYQSTLALDDTVALELISEVCNIVRDASKVC
jgi:hypothetical protein